MFASRTGRRRGARSARRPRDGSPRRARERLPPSDGGSTFLMQELQREANTLGSKSADPDTSRASVDPQGPHRADARAGAEHRVAWRRGERGSKHTGLLFVIAGPSGAGKSSLVRGLVERVPGVEVSVSHTTRRAREGERDGRRVSLRGRRVPSCVSRTRGGCSRPRASSDTGTAPSRDWVEERRRSGSDVLLEIDWQGAAQVREKDVGAITIQILPPSVEVLERRLRERGQDDRASISERIGGGGPRALPLSRLRLPRRQRTVRRRAHTELEAILRAERAPNPCSGEEHGHLPGAPALASPSALTGPDLHRRGKSANPSRERKARGGFRRSRRGFERNPAASSGPRRSGARGDSGEPPRVLRRLNGCARILIRHPVRVISPNENHCRYSPAASLKTPFRFTNRSLSLSVSMTGGVLSVRIGPRTWVGRGGSGTRSTGPLRLEPTLRQTCDELFAA